jgi:disulfide bond formation protein DsbB
VKLAAKLFIGGAIFYWLVAGIYFVMSHDEAGVTALVLTGGLSAMVGFYLYVTANRMVEQPEDNLDGEVADADADYGHFSPYSWAPLMTGAAGALTFVGLAVAAWMVVIGLIAVIMSAAFWLFEYYRGAAAHF